MIGRAWKHREVWSGPVLIGRGLDHKAELSRFFVARIHCSDLRLSPVPDPPLCGVVWCGCVSCGVTAAMAVGKRPVPFRTRKLSPPAPMVLPGGPGGRVGRGRTKFRLRPRTDEVRGLSRFRRSRSTARPVSPSRPPSAWRYGARAPPASHGESGSRGLERENRFQSDPQHVIDF